jgi:hypothetical protein
MSEFPPGGNGMIIVMDRVGYDPVTGMADCCARAASGHTAAAPPSVAKNFRRPMWLAM